MLLGTLKFPKLWNRLPPPPGLVPPVMSWTVPFVVTMVFKPEDVMGATSAWVLAIGKASHRQHSPIAPRRLLGGEETIRFRETERI